MSIDANILDPNLSDAAIPDHSDDEVVAGSIFAGSILTRLPRSPSEISAVIENVDWLYVFRFADRWGWTAIIDGDVLHQRDKTFGIRAWYLRADDVEMVAREASWDLD